MSRKPTLFEQLANNFWGCKACKIVPKVSPSGCKFNDVQICAPCKEKRLPEIDPDECEHEFDPDEGYHCLKGYHCLNCGLDGSEDVMADAYDRAKDARKYGDE